MILAVSTIPTVAIQINEKGICVVVKGVFDLLEISSSSQASITSKTVLMSFRTKTTTILRFAAQDLPDIQSELSDSDR